MQQGQRRPIWFAVTPLHVAQGAQADEELGCEILLG